MSLYLHGMGPVATPHLAPVNVNTLGGFCQVSCTYYYISSHPKTNAFLSFFWQATSGMTQYANNFPLLLRFYKMVLSILPLQNVYNSFTSSILSS
jgi:hypothetical protein